MKETNGQRRGRVHFLTKVSLIAFKGVSLVFNLFFNNLNDIKQKKAI